jgi:hypothetical protein
VVGEGGEQDPAAEGRVGRRRPQALEPSGRARVQRRVLQCDRQQAGLEPLTQIGIILRELPDRLLEHIDRLLAAALAPEEHATKLERDPTSSLRARRQEECLPQMAGRRRFEDQPLR